MHSGIFPSVNVSLSHSAMCNHQTHPLPQFTTTLQQIAGFQLDIRKSNNLYQW